MKRSIWSLGVAAAVALSAPAVGVLTLGAPTALTGCATVASGQEMWVVEAERALNVSFGLVDAFLKWEHDNPTVAPASRGIADQLRRDFPAQHLAATRALRLYKSTRGTDARLAAARPSELVSAAGRRAAQMYATP